MCLREEFKMILLNRANRVLGLFTVSQGGQAGTVADPKIIFATALKANTASIILAHNHPSGNLKPSQADISLTQKLVSAGQLLDIAVLDHLILTSEEYFSFADQGLM
jgi:DNA repair protein RadC